MNPIWGSAPSETIIRRVQHGLGFRMGLFLLYTGGKLELRIKHAVGPIMIANIIPGLFEVTLYSDHTV